MKEEYKIPLTGCLVIGLFDAIGTIAYRQIDFNPAILAPVSFLIYVAFGFRSTRVKNIKSGVLTAAVIGLFDSTIGWKISMLLKADTGALKNNPSIGVWVITIIVVTGLAALCGLIGGLLIKLFKRNNW